MSNEFEKKAYYSILFDYYKSLLTDKQQKMFIDYYFEDFSLSEIALEYEVSRNAVWDTITKVNNQLDKYESILGLFNKDQKLKNYLNELKEHTDDAGKTIINCIEEME